MGPRRTLKADRLKRLGTFALAAPSHALVKLIHLSSGRRHPICGLRPVPDVPAGPILASEVGGPKCKIWDAIGSDLLAGGAGGARLADPRIGSGPTWPRAEHEAAKCAAPSPKIEPFLARGDVCPGDQLSLRSTLKTASKTEKGIWGVFDRPSSVSLSLSRSRSSSMPRAAQALRTRRPLSHPLAAALSAAPGGFMGHALVEGHAQRRSVYIGENLGVLRHSRTDA